MFTQNNFAAASTTANSKVLRPILELVEFTPEYTQATDSYQLLRVQNKGKCEAFEPFYIEGKELKKLKLKTDFEKETLEKLLPVKTKEEAGNYPNTQPIVDKATNAEGNSIVVNAKMLENLVSQFKKLDSEGWIKITVSDALTPLVLETVKGEQNALGLLMPISPKAYQS